MTQRKDDGVQDVGRDGAQDGAMTASEFTPDGNERAFRDALGRFATGVTLVTCVTDQGPVGFAANSFAAVSLAPPLVLWSPARSSSRFGHFERARHFAIHVLERGQLPLLTRFARNGEGFDGLAHGANSEGVPVLAEALARFDCEQHATHDGGDHLIVVGRVLRAATGGGMPLVFNQGAYGHFTAG